MLYSSLEFQLVCCYFTNYSQGNTVMPSSELLNSCAFPSKSRQKCLKTQSDQLKLKLLGRKDCKPALLKDTNTCCLRSSSNNLCHFNQLLKFIILWKKYLKILNVRTSFTLIFSAYFHFMLICFHIICGSKVLQGSPLSLLLGLWGGLFLGNMGSFLTYHYMAKQLPRNTEQEFN